MTDPFTLTVTDTEDGMLYAAVHENAPDWADQTGWFDPDKATSPVTIIGCGGIGSNVAFELITMGFKRFVLYDDDIVEPRNLASQKAFRHRDLYRPKVEALAEVLIEYGAVEVLVRQRLFTAEDIIEGAIVIGAVDSMRSRKIIWEAVTNSPDVELYLDGRLGGQTAQIFAVEPLDSDWYVDSWLFGDEEAMTGVTCTMRAIVYPATVMAGYMCRHLSRWSRGLPICRLMNWDGETGEVTLIGDIEE